MTSRWTGFQSALGPRLEAFLAHKRALGCRFRNEESPLRLLDRFLIDQHIETIAGITPAVIDAFLRSRPRTVPQSYNHLLGVVARLFDWFGRTRDRRPISGARHATADHRVSSSIPV